MWFRRPAAPATGDPSALVWKRLPTLFQSPYAPASSSSSEGHLFCPQPCSTSDYSLRALRVWLPSPGCPGGGAGGEVKEAL